MHGPRFAMILGKRGKIKGLMLHDDSESYRLMMQRAYEEIADQLRMIAVHFEPLSQASPEARKMVEDHGLELASSRAYPSVFRMETWASGQPPRCHGVGSRWKPACG